MEEKINNKITEIKSIVKEITQHFAYTSEQINMITLAYLSMIMLDDEIEDLIMEALSKVKIIFTEYEVNVAYQNLVTHRCNQKILNDLSKDQACYLNYLVDQNGLYGIPIIILPLKEELFETMDSLTHELKHAVNEVIPNFFTYNNQGFYYSGLALEGEGILWSGEIDEAFNCYLTKIYLDNIAYLKRFAIHDLEIQALLNKIKIPSKYIYSSEEYVRTYKKLFDSKYLFRLFYYTCLYKDFDELDKAIEALFKGRLDALEFFDEEKSKKRKHIKKYMNHSLIRKRQQIIPFIK